MIRSEEKLKLEKIFEDISENGLLSGTKAKEMMIQTGIPVNILAKIWDMSDLDKDGALDQNEFIISMYLINKAKSNNMPNELPIEFYKSLGYPTNIPLLTTKNVTSPSSVLLTDPKDSPEKLFKSLDMDRDGFINGVDCKNIFLATQLSQPLLAHIWNICDIEKTGMLDQDHFKLAWYLINQKINNSIDPPSQFYPELIELSRKYNPNTQILLMEADCQELSRGNEITTLIKELEEINEEKIKIESKITARENELRSRNDIYLEMKKEVEILNESVKILENDKEKGIHRLDELNIKEKNFIDRIRDTQNQVEKLENEIKDINKVIFQKKVNLPVDQSLKGDQRSMESYYIDQLLHEEAHLMKQIEICEEKLINLKTKPFPSVGDNGIKNETNYDPFLDSFANATITNAPQTDGFVDDPFFSSPTNLFSNNHRSSNNIPPSLKSTHDKGFEDDPFAPIFQDKFYTEQPTFANYNAF